MRPDNQQTVEQQPQATSDPLNASTREEAYKAEFQAIIDRKEEKSPRAENLYDMRKGLCLFLSCQPFVVICTVTTCILTFCDDKQTKYLCDTGNALHKGCDEPRQRNKQMKQDITTLTAQELNGEKKVISLPKHTSLAELHTLIDAIYNEPMQISTTTGITALQPTESCWHTEKYPIEIAGADDNPTITLIYNDNIQQKNQCFFCCPCASSAAAANETAPLLDTP